MHLSAALSLLPNIEPAVPTGFTSSRTIRCAGVSLDLNHRRAFVGDGDLGLSPAEFAMVQLLFVRRGVPLSKEAIGAELPVQVEPSMIDVYVSRARAKLASAGLKDAIVTVLGRGYMAGALEDGPEDIEPIAPISSDLDEAMAPV